MMSDGDEWYGGRDGNNGNDVDDDNDGRYGGDDRDDDDGIIINHADVPHLIEDHRCCFIQEWVPVISQDMIRQRRLPRQAPFSDGYINGMPSKRRKVIIYVLTYI